MSKLIGIPEPLQSAIRKLCEPIHLKMRPKYRSIKIGDLTMLEEIKYE